MSSIKNALLLLSLLALASSVQAHSMHAMHELVFMADASTTTAYKCPVCGMSTMDFGYDNANYVELDNGQRVYTCGMDPQEVSGYSFEVTDTSNLAANMAAYVVNETDSTFSKCNTTCSKCADGDLLDPISGDNVTEDNFHYVCLKKGQSIYFASATTKDTYLANVNQAPRYAVKSVVCEGATCSDATKITTLSAAASSMKPLLSTASSSPTTAGSSSSTTTSGAPSVQTAMVLLLASAMLALLH